MFFSGNVSSKDDVKFKENHEFTRLVSIDFARGLACIGMFIYHFVYNLYTLGLVNSLWTRHPFWVNFQLLILSTFVFVSGMSFVFSSAKGFHWNHHFRRACTLGLIAIAISIITYIAMPNQFVRFGIMHFFSLTVLVAPLCARLKKWAIVPGIAIVMAGIIITRAGLYPNPWLYITGLMSDRPSSMDYIPLVPWFGVFLLGMGLANFIQPTKGKTPSSWMMPIIWLGRRALAFYVIHLLVIMALLYSIAFLVG